MGELASAGEHLDQVMRRCAPERDTDCIASYGQDPRILALMLMGLVAWLQGHRDQAKALRQRLMELAERLAHPFSLAIALQAAAWIDQHMDDVEAAMQASNRLVEISREYGFPFYEGVGSMFRGWCRVRQGDAQGVAEIEAGFHEKLAHRSGRPFHSLYRWLIAEAYLLVGEPATALASLERGITSAVEYREVVYESELRRLRACCLRQVSAGRETEVEAELERAMAVAHQQGALMLELRAAADLAAIAHERGEDVLANALLRPLCDTYPNPKEGPEFARASALLDTLVS
jgi:tetratricopeptide (TPR) repeat protein